MNRRTFMAGAALLGAATVTPGARAADAEPAILTHWSQDHRRRMENLGRRTPLRSAAVAP
jgi:hypothetical protein